MEWSMSGPNEQALKNKTDLYSVFWAPVWQFQLQVRPYSANMGSAPWPDRTC